MTERVILHGIGVSAGTASGPVAVVTPAVGIDQYEPCLLYTSDAADE